jgi:hypothetical protein
MKVAYIFSSQGHTVSYKLGKMILPQLEEQAHGSEVVGMFFSKTITTCWSKATRWANVWRRSRRIKKFCLWVAINVVMSVKSTASWSTAQLSAAFPTCMRRWQVTCPTR